MALPVTETFTATDGTNVNALTGWAGAQLGVSGVGFVVNGNQARANGSTTYGGNWWISDTFDDAHYAEATITAVANGTYAGVAARMGGTNNSNNLRGIFFFSAPDDGCYVDISDGSSSNSVAGPSTPFAVDDVVRIEVNGNNIVCKINGSTIFNINDSTLTGGAGGIGAYDNGDSRLDNWEAGNLGSSPVAPTVTSQAVSSIGTTTATGNGTVTDDGGATVTERGVVVNTTGTPTTADLKFTAAAGGTGNYTADMTGLTKNTHYYVRAYAINSVDTSYGDEVEFDTDEESSTVEQTAYRHYEDNGTEGNNTPLADENTPVSKATNEHFRTRLQANATGDPTGINFELEYRKWDEDLEDWGLWQPVDVDNAFMMLSVSGTNPRYLVNQNGDPVVLVGFHTWSDVHDSGTSDPPDAFDWNTYLTALTSRGLNFTKLWTFESPRGWGRYRLQNRYPRTGGGVAADGYARFDTSSVDTTYLDRLESRVSDCLDVGIYCCVQLFQGWDIVEKDVGIEDPSPYHPFQPGNNSNSIDGDTDNNGDLEETHILSSNPVITQQESFIEAVLDRLNPYPNIFYEVSNESTGSVGNTNWQNHVIDYIKTYEASLPYQHLVMFSVQYPSGNNATLDASDADLVSYNNRDETDGTKVSMSDTDHIEGLTDQFLWVWTSLCNGHGGLWYMDQWDGSGFGSDTTGNATYNLIRDNLGYAKDLIDLLNDLEGMTPNATITTTGLSLSKDHATEAEYVTVYNGVSTFNFDLTTATGTLNIRWLRCSTGEIDTDTVAGGANRTLTPPWTGAVVAYIYH